MKARRKGRPGHAGWMLAAAGIFIFLCCARGGAAAYEGFAGQWALHRPHYRSLFENTMLLPFSVAHANTFPADTSPHATLRPAGSPGRISLFGLIDDVHSNGRRTATPRRYANLGKLDRIILLFAGFTGLMIPFARKRYFELKRLADVVGSVIALSLLFPLMLLITLMIKIDSRGPVFFRQVRVGMNRRRITARYCAMPDRRGDKNLGVLFHIYKFRTMYADAESKTGPVWARENDERVTRVGRILRKTHLDEIPQFINVLKGEMCIIGPRPERPVFITRLNDCLPEYARRLEIKPGITGLAQVKYRYAASIQDAKIKLRYDLVYTKKMCFVLDMGILLNTFNIMVSTKGAR